jgi:hypothetical protein
MRLLLEQENRRRGDDGNQAVEAGIEEDTLKPAGIERKQALMTLMALLVISPFAAAAQKPTAPAHPATATSQPADGQLPKIWHSQATQHDYRVELTKYLFRAEWVNIPPASAKQGAYIHTECRRTGSKWVGSTSINMLFAVPGAPPGKDTKLCSLTMRFEVDSISPEKITGHSEALHSFDVNSCRVQETRWGDFTWVPKK